MSLDLSKAARLMKAVQLQSVRLIQAHAKSMISHGRTLDEVAADINFGGSALPQPAPDCILVHAGIEVRVRPPGGSEPVVTMGATFELQYMIPPDLGPTQEEMAIFAGSNAVFNSWPYWREYVQSTFLRMNLPPLLLPVLRIEDIGKELKGMPSQPKEQEQAVRPPDAYNPK